VCERESDERTKEATVVPLQEAGGFHLNAGNLALIIDCEHGDSHMQFHNGTRILQACQLRSRAVAPSISNGSSCICIQADGMSVVQVTFMR
jgi:hypothetical protein